MNETPFQADSLTTELSKELAAALDMLLSLTTDERTRLPKGELYTAMALNGARQALDKARAAGVLNRSEQ
jgi:hypothetical protein